MTGGWWSPVDWSVGRPSGGRGRCPTGDLHGSGGATIILEEPYGDRSRLWVAGLHLGERTLTLAGGPRASHPVRVRHPAWPIEMYQNVYATEPGSAEMPSAGRPFTPEVITRLVAKGVAVTPLVLHTGVASLEQDELPYPERVRVPGGRPSGSTPPAGRGHRVVAVGTTVVRALETSVGPDGLAHAYDGWTDLVVSPERPGPDHRRPAHRLARAGLVPPADARGDRRTPTSSGTPTGPRWPRGTAGTSSGMSI